MGVILGLYGGYIGVMLGLYWSYIGVILGLYWGYIGVIWGIMDKKMETTIMGYIRHTGSCRRSQLNSTSSMKLSKAQQSVLSKQFQGP